MQVFLQFFVYGYLFLCPAEYFRCLYDQVIYINRLYIIFAAACKTKKPFGEIGPAFNLPFNGFEIFIKGMVFIGFHKHERCVAENAQQQIIEVMGDSSGKCADGLHLLGMEQLFLQLFLNGYIPEKSQGSRTCLPRLQELRWLQSIRFLLILLLS